MARAMSDALAPLTVAARQVKASDLMFGGAGIAGMWATVSQEDSHLALSRAVELGLDHFDTAPWYGAGQSEDYFGQVLGDKPEISIATKAGRVIKKKEECSKEDKWVAWDNEEFFLRDGQPSDRVPVYDYSAAGIRESVRQSLERFKGHKIKTLRLHDAENEERYQWAKKEGAVEAMVALRNEGVIEEVSLGMNDASYLLKWVRDYPAGTFDNIMLAGCWNLVDLTGYELLQECQARGIKIHQAGVFGSGLLWGTKHLRYEEAPAEMLDKAKRWEELAKKHGVSLPATALAFSVLPTCVSYVCLGMKKARYVETNVALCDEKVPNAIWVEAKKEGLLPEWVPIPE